MSVECVCVWVMRVCVCAACVCVCVYECDGVGRHTWPRPSGRSDIVVGGGASTDNSRMAGYTVLGTE